MQRTTTVFVAGAVAGATLSVLAVTSVVRAQGPVGQPGGPGAGPGGNGGFARRMPFATGTVTAVDAQAGTVTINSQLGGNIQPQVLQVAQASQIVAEQPAKVEDLKRGDFISVRGVPSAITVSNLTAGEPPQMGFGNRGGAPANGAQPAATPARQNQGIASASGLVGVNPLTLWVDKDTPIALNLTKDAKVAKYATITVADIKAGDTVFAMGQTGQDGTFAATSVGVNLSQGAGMAGFGGRGFGAGGGFGGPGGGGFGGAGAGGFGGGRGRRNRGGGGAPGDGTQPAPPAPADPGQ